MDETLEPPTRTASADQFEPAADEGMSAEAKREVYNTFAQIESNVQGMARDIDRLGLGDASHEARVNGLLKNDGDSPFPTEAERLYRGIIDASRVQPGSESERAWGSITAGRLVASASNLSRAYRGAQSRGVLSRYTLPRSGAKGKDDGSGRKTIPPIDTVRHPLALGQDDTEKLIHAPEEEKVVVLSEMLDTHRFRHDSATPQDEVAAQQAEQQQIVSVLESMSPSWERDLLAIESWKYYKNPAINDGALAQRSVDLISAPELKRSVSEVDAHLVEHEPAAIVGRFRSTSRTALEKTEDELNLSSATRAQIDAEAEEASKDMSVTINMRLPQLARTLFDSHRLLSLSDVKRSDGNDMTSDFARRGLESDYGFYDEGAGDILPRPIYGAVAWGEDERLHGPVGARNYGDCVVTLKPEVAQKRTTYTYGDSGNRHYRDRFFGSLAAAVQPDHRSRVMTVAEMPAAKIIFDRYDSHLAKYEGEPADHYVEAQILGGIEIDDIESITLPTKTAYGAGSDPNFLERVAEMYPGIEIKVLTTEAYSEDPTKRRLMERFAQEQGIEFIIVDGKGGVISASRSEQGAFLSRKQLDAILQDPNHTPDQLLGFLDGTFKEALDADAGVHEGYSIREHTGMVLNQYKKYLTSELPDSVDPELFEFVLALHDIGKPAAIKETGDTRRQHDFTIPVVKETMQELGFKDSDIKLATALINGDPIGTAMRGEREERVYAANKIKQMAAASGLDLDDFWQTLLTYYKADASSYTEDAGGQRSLDHLFQFNPNEGKLSFASEQQQAINALRQELPIAAK